MVEVMEPEVSEEKDSNSKVCRIPMAAYDAARKASAFTGESIPEYIGRVILEAAAKEIEKGFAEWKLGQGKKGGKA